jgi:hypothetical protein
MTQKQTWEQKNKKMRKWKSIEQNQDKIQTNDQETTL